MADADTLSWLTYHDPPVRLHSGDLSNWLIDGNALFEDPNIRMSVLECWERALKAQWGELTPRLMFAGVPRGGIPWANAIAERFPEPLSGDVVTVLIDDVVTTGSSIGTNDPSIDWRLVVVVRNMRLQSTLEKLTAWMWLDLE